MSNGAVRPDPAARGVLGDVLAGFAVAGVLLPEAVAYAAIAGVPPMHAFVAAFCGLALYPVFGSSRLAIVAPTSSAAAIFAGAVGAGGPDFGFALVGLTAVLFLLAALFKAEFLGSFISRPVLRGFAWALTLTIVLKQLPHMLGIQTQASQTLALAWELLTRLTQAHGPSLGLAATALAAWLLLRHGAGRFVFVPPSLVVLGLGVVWSASVGGDHHRVALVGTVEWQELALGLPRLDVEQWLHAAQIAPALLLILFAESWGSVRSLALQSGGAVSTRKELTALGASNLASALLHGLPVGAGFSATAANQSAGASSKLAGLAAALALAVLLVWGRRWLALLPVPVLAAVVVGILSHNIWPRSVIESLRLGKDARLAFVAAVAVLLFGVLFGMLVAVALSLMLVIRQFSKPLVAEIARLPGTHDFLDCQHHAGLEPSAPGILLMRAEEPLFFANAEAIFATVRQRAQAAQARIVVLSMEMCDDLDSTTVETIGELLHALQKTGCDLLLARLKDRARQTLQNASLGSLDPHGTGGERFFWSVDDAYRKALALLR